jgi:hypothetical protein
VGLFLLFAIGRIMHQCLVSMINNTISKACLALVSYSCGLQWLELCWLSLAFP